jgi:hypothetical protein
MSLTGDPSSELLSRLVDSVKEISGLPECRNVFKKTHGDLVRRIKLLSPMFEELKDNNEELSEEETKGFELLRTVLDSAKELLKSVVEGSKVYQVLFFVLSVWLQGTRKMKALSSLFFLLC